MEQLDLKYLPYALAVARCGSVTRAARELYLAQPNLSRAIAELEQSLGFPLFIRTRQGMSPTPQGEKFLTEAEGMLDRLSALARECRQAEGCRLHLACVPSSLFVNTILEAGVSKRRVKGSQRGKKGQQPLDDENDSGLSAIRNGCRPEQKQQELPGAV